MKNLIIHPYDPSTEFLCDIYRHLLDTDNTTIVRGGVTKAEVHELILEHDRIFMMGHGSPSGLFAVNKFPGCWGHIIDYTAVPLLRDKECIAIWCNADKFMNYYKLNGLYSGMFISEVNEATYCGLPNIPKEIVIESNNSFAKWLGDVANQPLFEAYNYVMSNYKALAEINPIALYNVSRMYLKS
jgi:hypothetical protein